MRPKSNLLGLREERGGLREEGHLLQLPVRCKARGRDQDDRLVLVPSLHSVHFKAKPAVLALTSAFVTVYSVVIVEAQSHGLLVSSCKLGDCLTNQYLSLPKLLQSQHLLHGVLLQSAQLSHYLSTGTQRNNKCFNQGFRNPSDNHPVILEGQQSHVSTACS